MPLPVEGSSPWPLFDGVRRLVVVILSEGRPTSWVVCSTPSHAIQAYSKSSAPLERPILPFIDAPPSSVSTLSLSSSSELTLPSTSQSQRPPPAAPVTSFSDLG